VLSAANKLNALLKEAIPVPELKSLSVHVLLALHTFHPALLVCPGACAFRSLLQSIFSAEYLPFMTSNPTNDCCIECFERS
jgi:hypothetical protein